MVTAPYCPGWRFAILLVCWLLAALPGLAQQAPIQGLPFWEWQRPQPTGYGLNDLQALNDSVAVAVGSHGTAVKTTDGGQTWQTLDTRHTREVTSVGMASAQVGWLGTETEATTLRHVKAGPGQVLRTTDGGTTWLPQPIGEPTLRVLKPQVVAVSPTEAYVAYQLTGRDGPPNYFYLPYEPRLRHTVDGGQTWTRVVFPTDFNSNFTFGRPVFATPTTGLLISYSAVPAQLPSQLLRTTDGGQTWQDIQPGIGNGRFSPTQLLLLDAQRGFLVGQDLATYTRQLYHTADGGATWTLVGPLSFLTGIYVPGPLTFADPLHGLISEPGAYYATADGGLSWSYTAANMPRALFYNVRTSLQPGGMGWAFSPNSAAIFRTRDFGQHFRPVGATPAEGYRALAFPDPTHGWALPAPYEATGNLTLLRTTNRGTTWRSLRLDSLATGLSWVNAGLRGGAFPDADTAWVVGDVADTIRQTYHLGSGGLLARWRGHLAHHHRRPELAVHRPAPPGLT